MDGQAPDAVRKQAAAAGGERDQFVAVARVGRVGERREDRVGDRGSARPTDVSRARTRSVS